MMCTWYLSTCTRATYARFHSVFKSVDKIVQVLLPIIILCGDHNAAKSWKYPMSMAICHIRGMKTTFSTVLRQPFAWTSVNPKDADTNLTSFTMCHAVC